VVHSYGSFTVCKFEQSRKVYPESAFTFPKHSTDVKRVFP